MSACDNHVDIVGSRFYRAANFGHAFGQRRKAGGESGGNRGNPHAATLEGPHRRLHKSVVHTDGGHLEVQFFDSQALYQVVLKRVTGFSTQAAYAFFGVVA